MHQKSAQHAGTTGSAIRHCNALTHECCTPLHARRLSSRGLSRRRAQRAEQPKAAKNKPSTRATILRVWTSWRASKTQINEATDVMRQNIEQVVGRGEHLELLVDKSDGFSANARSVQRQSTDLRGRCGEHGRGDSSTYAFAYAASASVSARLRCAMFPLLCCAMFPLLCCAMCSRRPEGKLNASHLPSCCTDSCLLDAGGRMPSRWRWWSASCSCS